jgi:hypothetical protein
VVFVVIADDELVERPDTAGDELGARLPPVVELCPQSIITRLPLLVVMSAQAPCSTSKTSRYMQKPLHKAPASPSYMVCREPEFNTIS